MAHRPHRRFKWAPDSRRALWAAAFGPAMGTAIGFGVLSLADRARPGGAVQRVLHPARSYGGA